VQITKTLGGEIKNYVHNLLGNEAIILDQDGNFITVLGEEEAQNFDFASILVQSDPKSYKAKDGKQFLSIPLEFQNQKVAYLILDESKEKLDKYSSLIKSFAELLIQQYYENNKPALDSTDQFIIKLLNNAGINDFPFYESEAKSLGYNLDVPRLAIVVHLNGFWENCLLSFDQPSFQRDEVIKNHKRTIETAINSFFSKNTDIIIAYLGNDKFVVFKAINKNDEANVIKFLRKSYKAIFEPLKNSRIVNYAVGYGNSYTGISGMINAFKEADLSIELGQKIWGPDKSYFFNDLGILSILGQGNRDKNLSFADQLLAKMSTNEDLNKTLECFFDKNLNLTETAEKLGVHRNTIIYRLNQISKILGADPRIFEQAMTIKIALLIKRLLA